MNDECKHCNGKGEYYKPCEPYDSVDEEGHQCHVWANKVKCEWCIGTGIHTPLSEDPYI